MAKPKHKYATDYPYTQEWFKENIETFAPLSIKQEKYLNDKTHDIIIWGGAASSGKSYISALDILVNGYSDKHYRAGILRRQKEQLKGAGSLYDECCNMYSTFGVKPRGQQMDFNFPSGAIAKMSHSDRPSDKHSFQGWQCTTFLCDEAQQFNKENIVYLTSRLRSKSKKIHQLKLTCNPDYNSFIREWLEQGGYIDEDGLPIKAMDGVTKYYAEVAGEEVFMDSYAEFKERYGELDPDLEPYKFTFYAANCYDNPWIVKHQPAYISKLKNLPKIERARLFEGSWYAKEEASGVIKTEWFNMCTMADVPKHTKRVRCWDRAATLPSSAYPDPDWSVGVKGTIDEQGNLYIMDAVRLRDRPAIVQQAIEEAAEKDGSHCIVGIPQDVGAAGKEAVSYAKASLMKKGFNVVVNRANQKKSLRFEPFSIAAQNRCVYIVKGDWNKWFFDELEQLDFDNKRSHDDAADCCSDLWHVLTKRLMMPSIKVNSNRKMTRDTKL